MKIGSVAGMAFLLCLGMTPQRASATGPDFRAHPLGFKASARRTRPLKVHQATGEVLAVSAGSLILLHARGWKKQKMAFTLAAQTASTAGLRKGERIVVFYREIRGQRIVTQILPAAPSKRAQGVARMHEATGEVLAVSAGSLVLLHARGRAKRRMAFTLAAQTANTAGLRRGERIVVFYREIHGQRIVARIRLASPSKHAHRAPATGSHS